MRDTHPGQVPLCVMFSICWGYEREDGNYNYFPVFLQKWSTKYLMGRMDCLYWSTCIVLFPLFFVSSLLPSALQSQTGMWFSLFVFGKLEMNFENDWWWQNKMQLPGSKLCSYETLRTAAADETFKVHNVEKKLESLLMCELICYVCAKPTNCPGLKTEEFTGHKWKLSWRFELFPHKDYIRWSSLYP